MAQLAREFATSSGSPVIRSFRDVQGRSPEQGRVVSLSHVDTGAEWVSRVGLSMLPWLGPETRLEHYVVVMSGPNLKRVSIIDTLGLPRLRVVSPFFVEIVESMEEVTALHRASGIFGVGGSEPDAIADFRAAVVEMYDNLQENRARLGPAMLEIARVLESMVVLA